MVHCECRKGRRVTLKQLNKRRVQWIATMWITHWIEETGEFVFLCQSVLQADFRSLPVCLSFKYPGFGISWMSCFSSSDGLWLTCKRLNEYPGKCCRQNGFPRVMWFFLEYPFVKANLQETTVRFSSFYLKQTQAAFYWILLLRAPPPPLLDL